MPVRIITDSGSDIDASFHPNLTVLPLSIMFGETTYQDGVDITHERFYELLIEGDELPTTGQVNPFAFAEAIRAAQAAGEDVVVITLSSKLSGTHGSALTAAEEVGGEVHVVDSKNATVGERVLVELALRLVDEGKSAAEIAQILNRESDRVSLIALLDTLEFLRRGGRIPSAVGVIGEVLAVKPVIAVEDGEVKILGKARGSKNGRNLLNQRVEELGGIDFSMPLTLGYTGLSDAVLQKYIRDSRALWEEYPGEKLPVNCVGATVGTHVGPGAIAVAFFRKA